MNIFSMEVSLTSSWGKQRYLLLGRFQLLNLLRIHLMKVTLLSLDRFMGLFQSSIAKLQILGYNNNNKFNPSMDLHVPQPTLSEDTNRKLQSIRKNILHDVLKFNLQSSTNRRQQMVVRHSMEQQQMNRMIDFEQENIRREKQQGRLNMIRRRQMLKQEYDRQIREKEERKRKEKQYDRIYAKIEKDYQDASNQRRIYDIQRMFNRKSYQASINDLSSGYKLAPSSSSQRDRIRTEPDSYNPEANYHRYESVDKKQKLGYQLNSPSNQNYKDSIDRIKYPPQQSNTKNLTSPTTENVNSMAKQPANVSKFRLDYN